MRRWFVVFVFVASGCIESGLTPCETQVCPADKVCHAEGAPTCVYPEQLTACTDKADGEPCTIRNTPVASCIASVCQPVECGNGVRTTDEACDDGNNANGDGCSADCTSDESCGNGKTDLAASEQCDDGNDDDLDACRNTCVLPRCGDMILDALEECEPAVGLSQTCSDFGYYAGTLGCSDTCRFDPAATCVGRCGDAIVQTVQGEECDGAPPAESCIDLGYDYGAATCTSSCSAASCGRFGWTYLTTTNVVVAVAGDNGRLAVIPDLAGPVMLETPTGWTTKNGLYVDIDAHGSIVLAATASTLDRFAGDVWSTVTPAPPLGTSTIRDISLGDDDTPTVLACGTSACSVMQLVNGAWTSEGLPASSQLLVAHAAGNYALTSTGNLHYVWPGGSLDEPATNVVAIDVRASDLVYYWKNGADIVATQLPQASSGGTSLGAQVPSGGPSVAVHQGLVYTLDTNSFNLGLLRGGNGHSEIIAASPDTTSTQGQIFVTRDGRVIAQTSVKLWELQPYALTKRATPVADMADFNANVAIANDGTWLTCERDVWASLRTGWTKLTTSSANGCHGLWGSAADDVYVSIGTGGNAYDTRHYDGVGWTSEMYQGAPFDARSIVGSTVPNALLAGDVTIRKIGNTWSALPALPSTCIARALAMGGTTLYVAGSCTSPNVDAIWSLSGSTWTEVYSATHTVPYFTRLSAAADGTILAVLLGRVITNVGGSWTSYSNLGNFVAAISTTDAFMAGSANSLGVLQHWDGERWSPVNVDSALTVTHLIATDNDVMLAGYHLPSPVPVYFSGYLRQR